MNENLFNFQTPYVNLNNKNVALILGTTEGTVSRWKRGKSKIEDPKYIFGLKMLNQICSKLDTERKDSTYYEYYFVNILRYRFNLNHFFSYPQLPPLSNVEIALDCLNRLDKLNISIKDFIKSDLYNPITIYENEGSKQIYRNSKIYYFENESLSYTEKVEVIDDLKVKDESIIVHLNNDNKIIYTFPSTEYKNVSQYKMIDSIIYSHINNFLLKIDDYDFILELLNSTEEIDNFGLLYLYNHYVSLDKYINSKT